MYKYIDIPEFMQYLFDDEKQAQVAGEIVAAILGGQSPRISKIAEQMSGRSGSNYRRVHRFLKRADMSEVLLRLYHEEAEFVIGDPTEMPRYKAPKTAYVGTLSDGKTPGYWLLALSTPFRGRAIPFHFITYSSQTIGSQVTSRNQEHFRSFAAVKEILGEKPLVLDREFSYQDLMTRLVAEEIQFVIRLNLGDQRRKPRILDADGQPIRLYAKPGKTLIRRRVYYLGVVPINLIGYWRKGLSGPLWIMTTLDPKLGLDIYLQRMKIELTFRHCKDLLQLPRLMNKRQDYLEKMISLVFIAFVIGLLFGEAIRDVTYGRLDPAQIQPHWLNGLPVTLTQHRKWKIYSGLFVLLKQKPRLPDEILLQIARAVLAIFPALIFPNVRSFVST